MTSVALIRTRSQVGRSQASQLEGVELLRRPSQIKDLLNLYLSLPSLVLGINRVRKDWFLVVRINVTVWAISSWCQQHYKVTTTAQSHVNTNCDMTLDAARVQNSSCHGSPSRSRGQTHGGSNSAHIDYKETD